MDQETSDQTAKFLSVCSFSARMELDAGDKLLSSWTGQCNFSLQTLKSVMVKIPGNQIGQSYAGEAHGEITKYKVLALRQRPLDFSKGGC